MQVPPELLAQLGVSGTPQGGEGPYSGGSDPLTTLQECLQALPGVIAALTDPKDVQDATRAMLILTTIQQRLMQPSGGQPGQ